MIPQWMPHSNAALHTWFEFFVMLEKSPQHLAECPGRNAPTPGRNAPAPGRNAVNAQCAIIHRLIVLSFFLPSGNKKVSKCQQHCCNHLILILIFMCLLENAETVITESNDVTVDAAQCTAWWSLLESFHCLQHLTLLAMSHFVSNFLLCLQCLTLLATLNIVTPPITTTYAADWLFCKKLKPWQNDMAMPQLDYFCSLVLWCTMMPQQQKPSSWCCNSPVVTLQCHTCLQQFWCHCL